MRPGQGRPTAARTLGRLLVGGLKTAMLLMLVVLPVPAAVFLTRLIRPDRRRSVATQSIRKE